MAVLMDGFKFAIDVLGARFHVLKGTPPAIDFGEKKDVTDMENVFWKTFLPRRLAMLGDITVTVKYDPAVYDFANPIFGQNSLIVFTFPDGATLAFWGWINKFDPGEMVDGTQPEATVTIVPSMMDTNCVEQDYVFTEGTPMCI